MDHRLDAMCAEIRLEVIARRRADNELMIDVLRPLTYLWEKNVLVLDPRQILGGNFSAFLGQCGKMRQLRAQKCRLYLIETRVYAAELIMIFFLAAVVSQHTDFLGKHCIVCHDSPRITECTEVLRRVKAETADMTETPRHRIAKVCPMRLGTVLNNSEMMPLCHLHDMRHVGRLSIEMHDHHRSRTRGNRCLNAGGVDAVVRIRLDKDGRRPILRYGKHRRDIGIRGNNDLVPHADPKGTHRERQRIES